MEEGPHTQIGKDPAEAAGKVVRLPRDWLGPHEELVPFGSQAAPSAPPPSAADFWGERSAAIHDVVSAPDGDETPIVGRHRRLLPRVRFRRRSVAIASVVVVAGTGTIGLLLGGSGQHAAAGARLDIASAFRNGVRILEIGPPRIVSPNRRSRSHARRVPRATDRSRLTKPAPAVTQQRSHSSAPAPTYAAHATPASATQSYRPNVTVPTTHAGASSPPPSSSPSPGATASPTGQLGALGPIQSPNG